jgi:hypothetical protein
MLRVSIGDWIRRLFSSSGPDDEAAERAEYGVSDHGEREVERDKAGQFEVSEAAEAAESELDQLEAPRDPSP